MVTTQQNQHEFELTRILGSGQFATVYEATHVQSKEKYAVKVMTMDNPAEN